MLVFTVFNSSESIYLSIHAVKESDLDITQLVFLGNTLDSHVSPILSFHQSLQNTTAETYRV